MNSPLQQVSADQILAALSWRSAVKDFDQVRKIDSSLFEKLLEALRLTPSSFGLQAWQVLVVHNSELRKILRPLTHDQQSVTQCSHFLVFCTLVALDEDYVDRHITNLGKLRSTKVAELKSFRDYILEHYNRKSAAEKKAWLQHQTYIALGNMITLAALSGIDACPIEGFEPAKYDEVLQLKEYKSTVCLAMGYRAAEEIENPGSRLKMRKCKEELFAWL